MIKEFEKEQQLNKEEVDNLMKTPGNVKGVVFQTHVTFLRYKKGEKGIKKRISRYISLNMQTV